MADLLSKHGSEDRPQLEVSEWDTLVSMVDDAEERIHTDHVIAETKSTFKGDVDIQGTLDASAVVLDDIDLHDDEFFNFGTDDDFSLGYDSGDDRAELRTSVDYRVEDNNGNELATVESDGDVIVPNRVRVGSSGQPSDPLDVDGTSNFSDALTLQAITDPSHSEGQLWYSSDTNTLNFHNDRSAVTLNLGEEVFVRVFNNTGSTISNGDAVYISGFNANNGFPEASLAKADSVDTADLVGVATEDIADNASGLITTYGLVRNVDTDSFTAGDTVWLSASTAGELTATEPSAPNLSVEVGNVAKSDASAGQIFVAPSDRRASIYTSGSIPFADSNGKLIEDSSNLSWDDSNDRLGVLTNSPETSIHLSGGILTVDGDGSDLARFEDASTGDYVAVKSETDDNIELNVHDASASTDRQIWAIDPASQQLDMRATLNFPNITGTPTFANHDHSEGGMTSVGAAGIKLGNGLEGDGSDNVRVRADQVAGNVLSEDGTNPYQVNVNIGNGLEDNTGTLRVNPAGIAGDGLKETSATTLGVEPADIAGTFLSDDGSDNLMVDIGSGVENDGSDNIRLDEDFGASWTVSQTFQAGLTSQDDITMDDGSGNTGTIGFSRHNLNDTGKAALDDVSGLVIVINETDGETATFEFDTANNAVTEINDPSGNFSTTEDNDTTANVYFDSTNSQFELNNELGGSRTFKVYYLAA